MAPTARIHGLFRDDFVHVDVVRTDRQVRKQLTFERERDQGRSRPHAIEQAVVVALPVAHARAVASEAHARYHHQIQFTRIDFRARLSPALAGRFENLPLAHDELVHAGEMPQPEPVRALLVDGAIRHDDSSCRS